MNKKTPLIPIKRIRDNIETLQLCCYEDHSWNNSDDERPVSSDGFYSPQHRLPELREKNVDVNRVFIEPYIFFYEDSENSENNTAQCVHINGIIETLNLVNTKCKIKLKLYCSVWNPTGNLNPNTNYKWTFSLNGYIINYITNNYTYYSKQFVISFNTNSEGYGVFHGAIDFDIPFQYFNDPFFRYNEYF